MNLVPTSEKMNGGEGCQSCDQQHDGSLCGDCTAASCTVGMCNCLLAFQAENFEVENGLIYTFFRSDA